MESGAHVMAQTNSSPGISAMNILIVEDNVLYRETLKDILTAQFPEIHFLAADTGEHALEMTKDTELDLIFMDIRLPGKNGLKVTQEIKRMHAGVPIAVVSQYDSAEYKRAAHKYGADLFLSKRTSRRDDFIRVIEEVAK